MIFEELLNLTLMDEVHQPEGHVLRYALWVYLAVRSPPTQRVCFTVCPLVSPPCRRICGGFYFAAERSDMDDWDK